MNYFLLIGILVVGLGFALRLNTLLVVMAAGVITGLVAGMSINEIMELFGKYFIENRYMTLTVVLMMPVVGLLERYGLRERAETLIKKTKSATAGRVLILYTAIRQISVAVGVNIGGHAPMVRPLVSPMAEGAARLRRRPVDAPAQGPLPKTHGLSRPRRKAGWAGNRTTGCAARGSGNHRGEFVGRDDRSHSRACGGGGEHR